MSTRSPSHAIIDSSALKSQARRRKIANSPEKTVASDEIRPTPEHFLTMIRQQQRGRLKVYLGFAAGVGKTYEMLQEGQRLKARAWTWSSASSRRTAGRNRRPVGGPGAGAPPRIEYRGGPRGNGPGRPAGPSPTVALVDELAHTNAPAAAMPNATRMSRSCCAPGINVISTLNVQHLESLYDLVEKATGVKVKERIPDYVLGMADQLVNVDLSAEDLRERLHGRQDLSRRAHRTGPGELFHPGQPDPAARVRPGGDRPPPGPRAAARAERTPERLRRGVMVCLSSRSPNAGGLLAQGGPPGRPPRRPLVCRLHPDPQREIDAIDCRARSGKSPTP